MERKKSVHSSFLGCTAELGYLGVDLVRLFLLARVGVVAGAQTRIQKGCIVGSG